MDGVGEWATTSTWIGKKNGIDPLWEISFPHSLGLLYSAFTYYCGFKVNSGEYKLMGLAPYGTPIYPKEIWVEGRSGVQQYHEIWQHHGRVHPDCLNGSLGRRQGQRRGFGRFGRFW